jgi:hypothetical protein
MCWHERTSAAEFVGLLDRTRMATNMIGVRSTVRIWLYRYSMTAANSWPRL